MPGANSKERDRNPGTRPNSRMSNSLKEAMANTDNNWMIRTGDGLVHGGKVGEFDDNWIQLIDAQSQKPTWIQVANMTSATIA
jgi:hypothetical protein